MEDSTSATTTATNPIPETDSPSKKVRSSSSSSSGSRFVDAVASQGLKHAPKQLLPYIEMAKPYVLQGIKFAKDGYPYILHIIHFFVKLYEQSKPYHVQEGASLVCGLVLCFFGGHYMTLIAAVEAFRITGYSTIIESFKTLYDNFDRALEASKKDDEVDDDHNGIADVLEISEMQLIERKTKLFLKVCDPEAIDKAFKGICLGCVAVLSTLRSQFARSVTLGASISDVFYSSFERFVHPVLRDVVEPQHHKWIPFATRYLSRSIGISLAWWMFRFVRAYYSSIRGANLFLLGLGTYYLRTQKESLDKSGHLYKTFTEGTGHFDIAVLVLSCLGFLWQATSGFHLPFPMNIFLLPVSFVETILTWLVVEGSWI